MRRNVCFSKVSTWNEKTDEEASTPRPKDTMIGLLGGTWAKLRPLIGNHPNESVGGRRKRSQCAGGAFTTTFGHSAPVQPPSWYGQQPCRTRARRPVRRARLRRAAFSRASTATLSQCVRLHHLWIHRLQRPRQHLRWIRRYLRRNCIYLTGLCLHPSRPFVSNEG